MLVMVELEVGVGKIGEDAGKKNQVCIVPFQVAASLVLLWLLPK